MNYLHSSIKRQFNQFKPTDDTLVPEVVYDQRLRLLTPTSYRHYCPACDEHHEIHTAPHYSNAAHHSLKSGPNGPTAYPAIRVVKERIASWYRLNEPSTVLSEIPVEKFTQCHYWLINGRIEYETDCSHRYAGMSIPMINYP